MTGRFDDRQRLGRQFQGRYFAPYCNEQKILLDFGCGDGTILHQLPAKEKYAIEINEHCHKIILERNKNEKIPVRIFSDTNTIRDESVDIVISNHCLEHVTNPFGTLQEIHRVLRTEGEFVLVVPFDDWRSPSNKRWQPGDKDNHLYTWSPLNIGNLLSEAGFGVKEVQLKSFAWSPKIFWTRYFGETVFTFACSVLSRIRNRREVFCVATKSIMAKG